MIDILLIDREPLFQKAFTKMIREMEDCRVVGIAETESDAVQMFSRFRPRLVFADVLLGEEDGVAICGRLKEKFPKSIIYILSSYCNVTLLKNAMKSGIREYLYKPLSRGKLSSLISDCRRKEETGMDVRADKLFQAVDGRDYRRALDVSKELVEDVFQNYNPDRRQEALEHVVSSLFYMLPGMDEEQKEYYIQKYEWSVKNMHKQILCCNWLVEVITEVFRQLCVMKYVHMNQVFQYIEKNKNNEISLTELAGQAGISNGYLSRIFKKYYNVSVVDYIHLRKIYMAKYYMASTEMNISDVSFLLGYSEAGYFCKIFKKYEGMTPSAYYNHFIKTEKAV